MGGSRREEISRGARRSREEERGREDLKRERERGRRRKIAPDNSGRGKRKGGKEREAGERGRLQEQAGRKGQLPKPVFEGSAWLSHGLSGPEMKCPQPSRLAHREARQPGDQLAPRPI